MEMRIVEYASTRGALLFKMPPTTGRSHMPDRILLHPARPPAFLELKRTGERPTPEQLEMLSRLTDRGFQASWADTYAGAKKFIDTCLYRALRAPRTQKKKT